MQVLDSPLRMYYQVRHLLQMSWRDPSGSQQQVLPGLSCCLAQYGQRDPYVVQLLLLTLGLVSQGFLPEL